jgi:hypothetical protein
MIEERFSALLHHTTLAGIALGFVATLYFFAGLAGQIANPFANIFVAVNLAGAAIFFLYTFFNIPRDTNWLARIIWLVLLIVLGAEILLCLVPPTARDELTDHLAIPHLYVRAGGIIEFPIALYSYFPMLLDMLYTPWIHWGYDSIPKLVHALFGFLTGLSLYAYLSRRMNAVYGLLGFFFFISIPAVLRLSHWAYVDLGLTFYATASLLCLLRWHEEKNSTSWLVLAALSAGFAAATKPNGLVACFLLFSLLALTLAGEPQRGLAKIGSDLVLFVIIGALPLLPWLIKNWLQTGNPFFPLLGNFFTAKSSGEEGVSTGTFVSLGIFTKRALVYGENWLQIAALPIRVFFAGRDDEPRYFDGVLSPILILLLPWAFKGKWGEEKRVLISFAVLYFAYALVLTDLRIRYILLIVPPLVVLLVYAIFNIYLRIKQPAYLFTFLLIFATFHLFYLWRYFQEVAPLTYLSGDVSRSAYLTRMLPEYPVFGYINRELPGTAKIYLLFIGRRAYYCERDYFHDGGELPGFLLSAIRSAKNPGQIDQTLKLKGITHLMIREGLLQQFLQNNLTDPEKTVWNRFAVEELQLRFRDGGYALYQLHG